MSQTPSNWYQPIIEDVLRGIETKIGPGQEVETAAPLSLPLLESKQSQWMRVVTFVIVILLLKDIGKAFLGGILRSNKPQPAVVERGPYSYPDRQEKRETGEDFWQWLNRFVQP